MPLNQEHQPKRLLATGGAGFIGANFIHYWLKNHPDNQIINLDALTYAGNLANLSSIANNPNYQFVHGSINNEQLVDELMAKVDTVVHFAAESHVDRSIINADEFLNTNVIGTHVLLKAARKYQIKRFHHISTDEVFGSLSLEGNDQFSEATAYQPRSPYSASKAASDHLVRAFGDTYGLPFTITNCSNNYGEYQFPEKLIGLAITNVIRGLKVPIYGEGLNVRDWLYVQDHCSAIDRVLHFAKTGSTYVVGGLTEHVSNKQLIIKILRIMGQDESLIEYIADRPGHDLRYSVNWQKIANDLDWHPSVSLDEGLQKTVEWYKDNNSWWQPLLAKNSEYFTNKYGQ